MSRARFEMFWGVVLGAHPKGTRYSDSVCFLTPQVCNDCDGTSEGSWVDMRYSHPCFKLPFMDA